MTNDDCPTHTAHRQFPGLPGSSRYPLICLYQWRYLFIYLFHLWDGLFYLGYLLSKYVSYL